MASGEHQVTIDVRRFDLQGILIPGIVLSGTILAYLLSHYEIGVATAFSWTASNSKHIPAAVLVGVLFLMCAYVLGHVIDGFSQFFYEEIYMRRWRGFTFQFLVAERDIDLPEYQQWRDLIGQNVVGVVVLAVIALPVLRHYKSSLEIVGHGVSAIAQFVLVAIAALLVVAAMTERAHATIEMHQASWKGRLLKLLMTPGHKFFYRVLHNVVYLLITAREQLHGAKLNELRQRFDAVFGLSIQQAGRDAYWLMYLKLMDTHGHARDRINRAINHAIFSRNMAFAISLSGIILALATHVDGANKKGYFGECPQAIIATSSEAPEHTLDMGKHVDKMPKPSSATKCDLPLESEVSIRFLIVSYVFFVLGWFWISRFHHWFDYSTKMVVRSFLASDLGRHQHDTHNAS